jgi:hypothetical protein
MIAGSDTAASSVLDKVAAASLSGGLAAAVTSPIELIKTRLQMAPAGGSAQSRSSFGIIRCAALRCGAALPAAAAG